VEFFLERITTRKEAIKARELSKADCERGKILSQFWDKPFRLPFSHAGNTLFYLI
jgi:hypothetical protein